MASHRYIKILNIVKNLIIAGIILIVTSCSSSPTSEFTTIKVKEVEQVGSYTYLLVKAKGPEYWLAVPSMEATPGETYHYQGGMLMTDFYSKELDKTFAKVLFLEALFAGNPSSNDHPEENVELMGRQQSQAMTSGSKVAHKRVDVEVEVGEDAITISDLFSDPGAYEGKTVRVSGEVTKYNAAIMELNWVHIQDGTDFEGKFDLTATSIESFEVGRAVTLEGVLALNKDFGYGYKYEILLEKATVVK